MNIEEIMKPYFDKKNELDKKYLEGKNFIRLRLERLRDNKEQEIEEYVKSAVADRPDFYAGYGAMVRKDLEQSYAAKEAELEAELNNYDKFRRVDIRELVEIKHNLRKTLISTRKELEIKLDEAQLNIDTVMLSLSKFKYEYDENHNVLNSDEFRKLFEKSNSLVEIKYNLEKELKQVEENLSLTELTEEEVKTIMMSMTPLEKEEYDRRKALNTQIDVVSQDLEEVVKEEIIPNELEVETPGEPVEEVSEIPESPVEEVAQPVEDVEEPVVEEPENRVYESDQEEVATTEENYSKFLKEVLSDIIRSTKNLRTVKLENGKYLSTNNDKDSTYEEVDLSNDEMELPNGLYLNRKDISRALDNYRKQNKGRTFTVNGIELEVNRKTVRKIKKALRDCSIIKLLREKKLGSFDIKRVYGKEKADEYNNFARMGTVKTKMPSGEYINLADFYANLKDLFVEKSPSWLERLTSSFRRKNNEEIEYEELEAPSLSWSPDEPEYEIVKGKSR